jgi:hypothetical protein
MVGEYLVLATIDVAEHQNVPVSLSACHRKTLWLCVDVERKLAEAYSHDRYAQVILRRPRRPYGELTHSKSKKDFSHFFRSRSSLVSEGSFDPVGGITGNFTGLERVSN